MVEKDAVTIAAIQQAKLNINSIVSRTPLDFSNTFSNILGVSVYLKQENFQKTGSFKIRGAYNKILNLSQEEKDSGVIAASAGNHAQGVAFGAQSAGIKATIIMPEGAPITKAMATRGYGAEVILHGQSYDDAYEKAIEIQKETKATYIHAFDDPYIISGQGTVGLEILEDLPDVDAVIAPVGGGGLISGIAVALKSLRPQVKIFGVQAEGAPSMYKAREFGQINTLESVSTIADGIAVKRPGKLTFDLVQKYVDDIATVNDEEVAKAILMLLERTKSVVEGAGAVSLAALMTEKFSLKGKKVAVVLSGGNIDVNMVSMIIERGLAKAGRHFRFKTIIIDKPGALQLLLSVIAKTKANVISISHDRITPSIPLAQAEVQVALETKNSDHIRDIVGTLEEEGYSLN